ncbi:MAG: hypothetical protein MHPSP_002903, partial [Paramarteilia canceri]
ISDCDLDSLISQLCPSKNEERPNENRNLNDLMPNSEFKADSIESKIKLENVKKPSEQQNDEDSALCSNKKPLKSLNTSSSASRISRKKINNDVEHPVNKEIDDIRNFYEKELELVKSRKDRQISKLSHELKLLQSSSKKNNSYFKNKTVPAQNTDTNDLETMKREKEALKNNCSCLESENRVLRKEIEKLSKNSILKNPSLDAAIQTDNRSLLSVDVASQSCDNQYFSEEKHFDKNLINLNDFKNHDIESIALLVEENKDLNSKYLKLRAEYAYIDNTYRKQLLEKNLEIEEFKQKLVFYEGLEAKNNSLNEDLQKSKRKLSETRNKIESLMDKNSDLQAELNHFQKIKSPEPKNLIKDAENFDILKKIVRLLCTDYIERSSSGQSEKISELLAKIN